MTVLCRDFGYLGLVSIDASLFYVTSTYLQVLYEVYVAMSSRSRTSRPAYVVGRDLNNNMITRIAAGTFATLTSFTGAM